MGRFQPGNKEAKKKGKHEKTIAWEQLGDFFTEAGAERAKQIMVDAKDKDFMLYYTNFMEYFKPKLARTEVKHEGAVEVQVFEINGKKLTFG